MKFGDTLYLETVRLAEGIKKPSLRLDIQKALLAAHERVEELQDRLGLKLEPICHHEIHDVLHDAEICAKELANAKLHAENLEKQNAELKEMYKKADAAATYYRESCECQQKTIMERELLKIKDLEAALDLAIEAINKAHYCEGGYSCHLCHARYGTPAILKRQKELDAMEKVVERVNALSWEPMTDGNWLIGHHAGIRLQKALSELDAVRSEK